MIMCKHFIEWKKLSSKRCIGSIYGNFSTLADAKLNCISDSNCKGVYDAGDCNSPFQNHCYYLCHQTAALESNPGYPVYIKLGIQTYDSSTVVLVLYRYRIVVVKCIYFY